MGVAISNVLKVTAAFKFDADVTILNTFHFQWSSGVGPWDVTDFVTGVTTWLGDIYGQLASQISASVVPDTLKVDRVSWDVGEAKEVIDENLYYSTWDLGALNPAGTGETLPLQDSTCITLRTTRPKSRGRKFLPPMVESASSDGGDLAAAMLPGLALAITAAIADFTDGAGITWSPGVLSPYGISSYFLDFMSGTFSPQFCTRRSRRKGVGK